MFLINLQCIHSSILIHSGNNSLYLHTSQQPAPVQSNFVFGSINSIRRQSFPVWWCSLRCFNSCSKLGAFNLWSSLRGNVKVLCCRQLYVDSCVGKSVECMCEVECMLSFRLSEWEVWSLSHSFSVLYICVNIKALSGWEIKTQHLSKILQQCSPIFLTYTFNCKCVELIKWEPKLIWLKYIIYFIK